jgi:hypothetical protein
MLYTVIVRVPDYQIQRLEALATQIDNDSDWQFASSDEVMFVFSSEDEATAFWAICRLGFGYSCVKK